MGYALVQHAGFAATAQTFIDHLDYGSNVTSPNLLTLGFTFYDSLGASAPPVPTDGHNVWQQGDLYYAGNNITVGWFYCIPNYTGALRVTVTTPRIAFHTFSLAEWSYDSGKAAVLDAIAHAIYGHGTPTTAPSTGNLTLTSTDMMLAICSNEDYNSGHQLIAGSGFTQLEDLQSNGNMPSFAEYQLGVAAGSVPATFGLAGVSPPAISAVLSGAAFLLTSNLTSGSVYPGTVLNQSIDLNTTVAQAGTGPYTYQFQQLIASVWTNIGPNSSTQTLFVGSLTPSTAYQFRVIATDSLAATNTSAAVTITTKTPGCQVTNVYIDGSGELLYTFIGTVGTGYPRLVTAVGAVPSVSVNGNGVPLALTLLASVVTGGDAYTSATSVTATDGTHSVPCYRSIGSFSAVVSATESSTTATITTDRNHGLNTGNTVTVSGVSVAGYNGTFTVASVPTTTTFTYTTTSGLGTATANVGSVNGTRITSIVPTFWSSSYGTPTISITDSGGGTGATATVAIHPTWTSAIPDLPWVAWKLQTKVNPSDTVTWSAPDSWVSTASGFALSTPALTSVTNYSGQTEPAFLGTPTMEIGTGLGAAISSNSNPFSVSKNWRTRTSNPWTHTSDGSHASSTVAGRLISWTDAKGLPQGVISSTGNATTPNGVDTFGTPGPAGPSVVFTGGGGTGAQGYCTIVGGVIAGVVVTSGGSGYTSAPTVSFLGGGGWGATATCTLGTGSGGANGTFWADLWSGHSYWGNSYFGTTVGVSTAAVASVTVTAGGAGYCDGLWKVVWDDTNPSSPTNLQLVTGSTGSTAPIVTLVGSNAGNMIGGVQVGVSKTYYVQLAASPTQWSINLFIQATGGALSTGVRTSGITNEWVFAPNNAPDRSNSAASDTNTQDILSFGSGKHAAILRFMDDTMGSYGGGGNIVEDVDRWHLTDVTWKVSPDAGTAGIVGTPPVGFSRSICVHQIRPLTIGASPNVYVFGHWPNAGTSDNLTLAPYMFTPVDIGYTNGENDRFIVECVTTDPNTGTSLAHQLKTGQVVTFGSTLAAGTSLVCNNGGGPTVNVSLSFFTGPVWVTAPDRFVVMGAQNGLLGAGQPGNINTLASTTTYPDWTSHGGFLKGVDVEVDVPTDATMPYECAIDLTAKTPGCDLWLNLPPMASVGLITTLANACLLLPADRTVYLQIGNENWNTLNNSQYYDFLWSMGHLHSTPINSQQGGEIVAMSWMRPLFDTVFHGANRFGKIKSIIGSQLTNDATTEVTSRIVSEINAFNIANPLTPCPWDVNCIAPYFDIPGDPTFISAAASVAHSNSNSKMYNTSFAWDMAAYHSLWRHWAAFSFSYSGTGVNGVPKGPIATNIAAMSTYTPIALYGQGVGFIPEMRGYEGGIEIGVPSGVDISGSTINSGLSHDFYFHPATALAVRALYLSCQNQGMLSMNELALVGGRSGFNLWPQMTWAYQQPGAGDGSDGKTTNQYWVTDGASHDLQNVSPRLQAFRSWGQAANPFSGSKMKNRWFSSLSTRGYVRRRRAR